MLAVVPTALGAGPCRREAADPSAAMSHEPRETSATRASRYGASSAPVSAAPREVRASSLVSPLPVVFSFLLLSLATLGLARHAGVVPRRALGQGAGDQEMPPHADVRVPLPVLVVGLPKAGTTSLASYFACGGLDTSHYKCVDLAEGDDSFASDGSTMEQTCGRCIRDALAANEPPLLSCGNFEAWAQMDVAGKPLARSGEVGLDDDGAGGEASEDTCFFPQIDALDALDAEFPKATLVLNRRASPEAWLQSVDEWNDLRERLRDCDVGGLPAGAGAAGPEGDAELLAFVERHEANVRAFVAAHPSHALVEVTIEDPEAGKALEAAFGIPAECWGRENANELGSRLGNFRPPQKPSGGTEKVLVF